MTNLWLEKHDSLQIKSSHKSNHRLYKKLVRRSLQIARCRRPNVVQCCNPSQPRRVHNVNGVLEGYVYKKPLRRPLSCVNELQTSRSNGRPIKPIEDVPQILSGEKVSTRPLTKIHGVVLNRSDAAPPCTNTSDSQLPSKSSSKNLKRPKPIILQSRTPKPKRFARGDGTPQDILDYYSRAPEHGYITKPSVIDPETVESALITLPSTLTSANRSSLATCDVTVNSGALQSTDIEIDYVDTVDGTSDVFAVVEEPDYTDSKPICHKLARRHQLDDTPEIQKLNTFLEQNNTDFRVHLETERCCLRGGTFEMRHLDDTVEYPDSTITQKVLVRTPINGDTRTPRDPVDRKFVTKMLIDGIGLDESVNNQQKTLFNMRPGQLALFRTVASDKFEYKGAGKKNTVNQIAYSLMFWRVVPEMQNTYTLKCKNSSKLCDEKAKLEKGERVLHKLIYLHTLNPGYTKVGGCNVWFELLPDNATPAYFLVDYYGNLEVIPKFNIQRSTVTQVRHQLAENNEPHVGNRNAYNKSVGQYMAGETTIIPRNAEQFCRARTRGVGLTNGPKPVDWYQNVREMQNLLPQWIPQMNVGGYGQDLFLPLILPSWNMVFEIMVKCKLPIMLYVDDTYNTVNGFLLFTVSLRCTLFNQSSVVSVSHMFHNKRGVYWMKEFISLFIKAYPALLEPEALVLVMSDHEYELRDLYPEPWRVLLCTSHIKANVKAKLLSTDLTNRHRVVAMFWKLYDFVTLPEFMAYLQHMNKCTLMSESAGNIEFMRYINQSFVYRYKMYAGPWVLAQYLSAGFFREPNKQMAKLLSDLRLVEQHGVSGSTLLKWFERNRASTSAKFMAGHCTNNSAESANEAAKKYLCFERGKRSPCGLDDAVCKLYFAMTINFTLVNMAIDSLDQQLGVFNPQYLQCALQCRDRLQVENYEHHPMTEKELWKRVTKLSRQLDVGKLGDFTSIWRLVVYTIRDRNVTYNQRDGYLTVAIGHDPWTVTLLDNGQPLDDKGEPLKAGSVSWPRMRCHCTGCTSINSLCVHKLVVGVFLGGRCGFTLPLLAQRAHNLATLYEHNKRIKVNEGKKAPVLMKPEKPYGVLNEYMARRRQEAQRRDQMISDTQKQLLNGGIACPQYDVDGYDNEFYDPTRYESTPLGGGHTIGSLDEDYEDMMNNLVEDMRTATLDEPEQFLHGKDIETIEQEYFDAQESVVMVDLENNTHTLEEPYRSVMIRLHTMYSDMIGSATVIRVTNNCRLVDMDPSKVYVLACGNKKRPSFGIVGNLHMQHDNNNYMYTSSTTTDSNIACLMFGAACHASIINIADQSGVGASTPGVVVQHVVCDIGTSFDYILALLVNMVLNQPRHLNDVLFQNARAMSDHTDGIANCTTDIAMYPQISRSHQVPRKEQPLCAYKLMCVCRCPYRTGTQPKIVHSKTVLCMAADTIRSANCRLFYHSACMRYSGYSEVSPKKFLCVHCSNMFIEAHENPRSFEHSGHNEYPVFARTTHIDCFLAVVNAFKNAPDCGNKGRQFNVRMGGSTGENVLMAAVKSFSEGNTKGAKTIWLNWLRQQSDYDYNIGGVMCGRNDIVSDIYDMFPTLVVAQKMHCKLCGAIDECGVHYHTLCCDSDQLGIVQSMDRVIGGKYGSLSNGACVNDKCDGYGMELSVAEPHWSIDPRIPPPMVLFRVQRKVLTTMAELLPELPFTCCFYGGGHRYKLMGLLIDWTNSGSTSNESSYAAQIVYGSTLRMDNAVLVSPGRDDGETVISDCGVLGYSNPTGCYVRGIMYGLL